MLAIAQSYIDKYGDNAMEFFMEDLMRDDPANYKSGYTRENAVIAASDAFDVPREELA